MTDPSAHPFAYDEVAYPTPIVPEMNPSRIRAAGILHGFTFPTVASSAVLEIGCGDGYNLLGIAAASPAAHHVGFDLSPLAIARGQTVLTAAALANAELVQGDILTWSRPQQTFDYILCHGVHSWVPPHVQDALLALIAAQLSPGGVAYVSHDALPAASAKLEIKKFLQLVIPAGASPSEKIARARQALPELARHQRPQSRLKAQLDSLIAELPLFEDGYFFHDWLSEAYHPVSMQTLASKAATCGLQPIAEAAALDLFEPVASAGLASFAASVGQGYAGKAYLGDILSGARMFRRTILARTDAPPPSTADFSEISVTLRATVERDPSGVIYRGPDNALFRPSTAAERHILQILADAAPAEVPYVDLLQHVPDPQVLQRVLTQICAIPVAAAYASEPSYCATPGERPLASPLTREMLSKLDFAATLRLNRLASRQGATQMFLGLCDGTRTRAMLAADMSRLLGRDVPLQQIDAVLADMASRQVFLA
jgi:SAM-dependent methyltransferase